MGNQQSNFWEGQQFISQLKNNPIYGSVQLMKKGQQINAVMQFQFYEQEQITKLEEYIKLRNRGNYNSLIEIRDIIVNQSIPFMCGDVKEIGVVLEYSIFTLQSEIKNKSFNTIMNCIQQFQSQLFGSKFREDLLDQSAKDLIVALKFMEDNKLFHGMLAPQNIIYQKGLKILDLSKINNKDNYFLQICRGDEQNIQYLSPQYARAIKSNLHVVVNQSKSDVWSLGVVFLEMIHTDFLVQIYQEFDQIKQVDENFIKKCIQEGECSFFMKKLIRMMLQTNEQLRPNFGELVNYINSYVPNQELKSPPQEQKSFIPKQPQIFQPTIENLTNNQSINSKKKFMEQYEEIKSKYFQNVQTSQINSPRINYKSEQNTISTNSIANDQYKHQQIPQLIEEKRKTTKNYSDGSHYEGEMKNNMKEGLGTLVYKSGGYYMGHWHHDKMTGEGSLYYPNGQIAYRGSWKNDHFHGQGLLQNENPIRDCLQVNYKDLNCIGDQWVKYIGQFELDCKHGIGCLYFTTGERIEGQFANDKMHGKGTFFKQNGQMVKGLWFENQLIDLQKELQ